MKNLLPLVTKEVGFAIAKDMCNDDEQYVTEELQKIQEENPVIASFIYKWIKLDKKKEDKIHVAFCAIIIYKMLRSQAEADKMTEEFS
jgi:pyrroloquinoline quinone (PQQ) biosynthesis protein C